MPNRIYNKQVTPKGYKMGGRAKKMGGGMMMMERPMMKEGGPSKKPKVKKIAIGTGKAKDYPGIKKIIEMNKKGKKRFARGGKVKTQEEQPRRQGRSGLKPPPPGKKGKGLRRLPQQVRNKMGYMKKGGRVFGGGKK